MTTKENDQNEDWGNDEGLHLLATFAEQVARDDQGADEAGRALLAELASLKGRTTIGVTEDPASPTVKFGAGDVAVQVRHEGHGRFVIVGSPKRPISGLTFNQATKELEGPEYPEKKPWKRPRRRSAVAVIVEQVLPILHERIVGNRTPR